MAVLGGAILPSDVVDLAQSVATFIGVTVDDLIIADHTHEGLSEGAFSLAYEGDYDWPARFTGASHAGRVAVPAGWYLEAGAGWYLAAYPVRD